MATTRKPQPRKPTARVSRPRTTKPAATTGWTNEQLAYLAGIYESSLGLRGVSTVGAVAISKDDAFTGYLAKTYGGESKEFVANSGKKYWGWFVPIDVRLNLLTALEANKALPTLPAEDLDKIRAKQERVLNNAAAE
jgi:hypothetical protein